MPLSSWDLAGVQALNTALVGVSAELDGLLRQLAYNDLFKGAVVMALYAALFFGSSAPRRERVARRLLVALAMVGLALAFNRAFASMLEFRPRPLQSAGLDLRVAEGLNRHSFSDLSAFPSDHAVMFLGLAFGALRAHLGIGMLLLIHALIGVLLPRVAVGLHWPSDMLGGAVIAAVFVILGAVIEARTRLFHRLVHLAARWPGLCASLGFLLVFGYATLFDPMVQIARWLKAIVTG